MPDLSSRAERLRILLIDDNPDDRALVERELRLRIPGVSVSHVSDAGALDQALAAGQFDVAVTDYRLRWTLGTDVLRAIKQRYPNTPVVMFTGSGNEEVAVEAMKEGLDDYITKTPKHYPRVPYAVLGCFERVHNRLRLQESLAREKLAKARLEIALQSARMGTWQYDVQTGELAFSDEIGPMLGHGAGFVHATVDEALAQVHPADGERVRAAWAGAVERDAAFAIEARVLGADARTRWLALSGKAVGDGTGTRRIVVGTARDVTPEVEAKEAQRAQQEELQAVLDVLPVGVAISHDPQISEITVSPYFCGLLGIAPGTNIAQVLPQGDGRQPYQYFRGGQPLDPADWPIRAAARQGSPVRGEELEVRFDDGRALTILVNAAPLLDRQAMVRGAVAAIMDVSALKSVQRELEGANRQKTEFLSVLAHELRNPMAAISYSVEMLRHIATPDAINKARDVIGRQTAHMRKLLDDLLDLSRITHNRIDLFLKPLDLRRVIEHAYESTRALLEQQRHRIAFALPEMPLTVLGDEVRLTQVLSNLLNNAAKFTPAGGTITVAGAADGRFIAIEVTDNGTGIHPSELEHVFEMFVQGKGKASGGVPGLGIGLAIVRRLVELHGGTVQAFSQGPGSGTTFRIRLPRVDDEEATQSMSGALDAGKGGRLLVADDNTDAADLLGAVLAMEGYPVEVAYDGEAAIELAGRWRPDLMLLDIGMPRATGLDVARWIRAQEWGRDVVLVAITGWGQQEDRRATKEAGFDVHLVKPVSPSEIVALIGQHLGSRQRDALPAPDERV
ncbi:hybrid sensor histidine kinase/response regulator [Pseudoduganella umbonata]|uniref:histidine kinase n=1 Tax=Pseudoduganella umbonata TaxID=864828 RepID=A0A7W5EGV4_9BURK|nr:response regulator [Pseudoduganella umbonata]MBB3224901.1 signal transduction histidine kinase/DNA-binding response OmpR family regulator [Pseudoduganella umbonata]